MLRSPSADSGPRLLWLAHHAPEPATSGSRVYSAGLLSAAAAAGARITFLGLANPDAPDGSPPTSRAATWQIVGSPARPTVAALASPLPLVTARASPPALVEAARERLRLAADVEAVIVDNYAAGWVLDLLPRSGSRPKLVYIAHNDETRLSADIAQAYRGDRLRKLALDLNAWKIRRLERRLVEAADLVVTLTEEDRQRFLRRHPRAAVLAAPPGYGGARRPERRLDPGLPRRAVMVGSIQWIAKRMNVAAFLEVADGPFHEAGITFDVIGDVPDEFRAAWEPRLKATRFRGFVDDLAAEMAEARLGLVIEATGGGFKLKTLDYLFQRVPVAALTNACEGLPAPVTGAMLLAPDAPALTRAILQAIDDLPRLDRMQDEAFAAASRHFDWAASGRRLVAALAGDAGSAAA